VERGNLPAQKKTQPVVQRPGLGAPPPPRIVFQGTMGLEGHQTVWGKNKCSGVGKIT